MDKKETSNAETILEVVHETAKGLYRAGVMDEATMGEFDALCLPQAREYTSAEIGRIRKRLNLSQSAFAAWLNVTSPTVDQWERGATRPRGASLRLLEVVDRKGLAALA